MVRKLRIRMLLIRQVRSWNNILTERELIIFETLSVSRKVEFFAGRLAAKEAYSKANGTGVGHGCELHQIEILKDVSGKPILYFDGVLVKGFISITHTGSVAAAQVVLME